MSWRLAFPLFVFSSAVGATELPEGFAGAGIEFDGANLEMECTDGRNHTGMRMAVLPNGNIVRLFDGGKYYSKRPVFGSHWVQFASPRDDRWTDLAVWSKIESILQADAGKKIQTGQDGDRSGQFRCSTFVSARSGDVFTIFTQIDSDVEENYWDDAGKKIRRYMEDLPIPDHLIEQ